MGVVQTTPLATIAGSGTTFNLVFPSPTTAGHGIVVAVAMYDPSGSGTQGVAGAHDSISPLGTESVSHHLVQTFAKPNITGGDTTYTITVISGAFAIAAAIEIDDMVTLSEYDSAGSGAASGSSGATSLSVTGMAAPAQTDNLVLAVLCADASSSDIHISSPASSGYTSFGVEQDPNAVIGGELSYKFIGSNAVAQSASWTFDAATNSVALLSIIKTTDSGGGAGAALAGTPSDISTGAGTLTDPAGSISFAQWNVPISSGNAQRRIISAPTVLATTVTEAGTSAGGPCGTVVEIYPVAVGKAGGTFTITDGGKVIFTIDVADMVAAVPIPVGITCMSDITVSSIPLRAKIGVRWEGTYVAD